MATTENPQNTFIQYILHNGVELIAAQNGRVIATKTTSKPNYVSIGQTVERCVQGSVPTPDSAQISKLPQPDQYLVLANKKGEERTTTIQPIKAINPEFYLPADSINKRYY